MRWRSSVSNRANSLVSRQNTVGRQGSHSLSESQAVAVLHGNRGVCLHADVWWQHCYYGGEKKREIHNLKRKHGSLARARRSYHICILKKEPSQLTYLPPTTAQRLALSFFLLPFSKLLNLPVLPHDHPKAPSDAVSTQDTGAGARLHEPLAPEFLPHVRLQSVDDTGVNSSQMWDCAPFSDFAKLLKRWRGGEKVTSKPSV